jgi:hypothetical protein
MEVSARILMMGKDVKADAGWMFII